MAHTLYNRISSWLYEMFVRFVLWREYKKLTDEEQKEVDDRVDKHDDWHVGG